MGVRLSRPADMATPIGGNHGAGSVSADVGSQIPAVRRLSRDQPAEPDPGCDEHPSGSPADRPLPPVPPSARASPVQPAIGPHRPLPPHPPAPPLHPPHNPHTPTPQPPHPPPPPPPPPHPPPPTP